jgi:conjugal transfer ATP-binding protein TraC
MSDLIQGVDSFFLDGLYHRCITLKTLPESTYSAMISKLLTGLPFHYWLSLQITVPEQSKELSSLQAKRRMAHSMSMTQGGRASNLESEAKLQSTEELLRELLTTGQKIFYFQFALLLKSDSKDQLERMTKIALSKFRELNGAEAVAETVAGLKVFKTLLPAGNTTSVRSKRVKTDNLADFLPIYQPWERVGKTVCLFRNRLGGLLSYDPFDPALPNFNSLVTGVSGAGKSFLNNCILLQYLSQDPLLYIIDIGGSYRKLCDFMQGSYVESGLEADAKAPLKINPFLLPAGTKMPSPRKVKFLLALLEVIFTDEEGLKLPKLDKALLEEAVLSTYNRLSMQRTPKLMDLKETMEQSSEPALKGYAKMLFPWTGERPYGRLLDTDQNVELNTEFVVFDLKGLSSYPDLQSVMILILTDFILQKLDENPHRKKRILLDECWELLKTKPSRTFMEYCVRTLRKTGSGITFITQGLEEIEKSDIGAAILGNTATKLILMQRGGLESVSQTLKLNDREVDLIRGLRTEKGRFSEAFLMADERRGVIQITPTPLEYWIATSDAADNNFIAEAKARFPEKSLTNVIHWLAVNYPLGSEALPHLPEIR